MIKSKLLHICLGPFLFWLDEDDDYPRYHSLISELGEVVIYSRDLKFGASADLLEISVTGSSAGARFLRSAVRDGLCGLRSFC